MVRQPLRSNDIRESNEKLVLSLVFHNTQLSQSQVVQLTGLKAPTVYRIFAKLEAEQLIQLSRNSAADDGHRESERKGRRPSFYKINPNSGYAVGIDFSIQTASVIVVDFANDVIYDTCRELEPGAHLDHTLSAIDEMIRNAIVSSGISAEALIGIGIGSPGMVDTVTGEVLEYERIKGLAGFNLKKHFEALFGAPVLVHNNASVIASSAYHYGIARGEDSLLAVLVRSGVGGALVNQGRIFLNGNVTALEVGRTLIEPGGPSLESIVSERALLEMLQKRVPIASWQEAQEQHLGAGEVADALRYARTVFAAAIENLDHLFHPEAVLIIARYALLAEVLGNVARETLPNRRVISMVYDAVQACYGATDLVFQQFFLRTP
ncbi:MAG: ROK family protein [Spirochaetaceae bacterium]|nr:MAG: ROK family protein [Spirochaetaceae bacterium]